MDSELMMGVLTFEAFEGGGWKIKQFLFAFC